MKERKADKKTVALLAVCAALLAVVLIAGVFLVRSYLAENSYQESIRSAEKYVETGNLEQAVVAYQNAIEAQPEEDDGYLGLADVYLQQDEVSQAKIVLKKGYLRTSSVKIQYMLTGIEDGSLLPEDFQDEVKKRTLEFTGPFGWNTMFIQKLEHYTYQDFQTEYGSSPQIVKEKKGALEVAHPRLPAICYYANTSEHEDIVDDQKNRPDETGMPERVTLDSLSLLFQNFGGSVSLGGLQSISSSKVEPVVTEERTYVELTTASLVVRIETDAGGNIVSDTAWNEILLTEANQNRDRKGVLAGIVTDAVTGEGVDSARLFFEASRDSSHSEQGSTSDGGAFSVELEPDIYTITISCDGYMEESFEFEMEKGRSYSGEQFIISPNLAEGTARIVLEWGAQPRDLDSYLIGESDSAGSVFVGYYDKVASFGGETIAELDVDDVDGYGPETITLYDLNGVYKYTVVDYRSTSTLQQYGATVKVYLPGQDPVTISVEPGAGIDNYWEVFELDHGQLNIWNRAGDDDSLRPGTK